MTVPADYAAMLDTIGAALYHRDGRLLGRGVEVVDLADERCITMLGEWIQANPKVWNEDIGDE